jgi:hypothetical protein
MATRQEGGRMSRTSRHTGRRLPTPATPRQLRLLAAVLAVALCGACLSAAAASAHHFIPGYALRAVNTEFGQHSWSIWLFGRGQNGLCLGTRATAHGVRDEGGYCHLIPSKGQASPAARGVIPGRHGPRTVLFFVLPRDAQGLKLVLESASGERRKVALDTRHFSRAAERRARFQGSVATAAAFIRGRHIRIVRSVIQRG